MDSTRKRGYGVTFSCAVVLLTLAVYVGAYFSFVGREYVGFVSSMGWKCESYVVRYSDNPSVDGWMAWVFAPLNSADQKIRPDYWNHEEKVDFSKYSAP
jgi:hypothetical protein